VKEENSGPWGNTSLPTSSTGKKQNTNTGNTKFLMAILILLKTYRKYTVTGASDGDEVDGIIKLQTSDRSFKLSGNVTSITHDEIVSYMNLTVFLKNGQN
jgi:hypothetical protein